MAGTWDVATEQFKLNGKVKTLLNNELKDILREEHLPLSGNKGQLQARVLERGRHTQSHPGFTTLGSLR